MNYIFRLFVMLQFLSLGGCYSYGQVARSTDDSVSISMVRPPRIVVGNYIPWEFNEENMVIRSFFESGEVREEYQYRWIWGIKNGKHQKNGFYHLYNTSGDLLIKGFFVKEKKDGIWYYYDENGKVIKEQTWARNKLMFER